MDLQLLIGIIRALPSRYSHTIICYDAIIFCFAVNAVYWSSIVVACYDLFVTWNIESRRFTFSVLRYSTNVRCLFDCFIFFMSDKMRCRFADDESHDSDL